ncbi:MAG: hypothetical protein VXY92_11340 [Planctomycetota bacterium]|nr:hypothetical protein [Planctomycetota bacterium]
MKRSLLLSCLLAVAATAQNIVVDAPNIASTTNLDRPFGGGVGRYQQWYNPNPVLTGSILEPMRITQVEFLCGSNNTQAPQPVTVNCEVFIGHGKFSGVFGFFGSNFDDTPQQVFGPFPLQQTVGPQGSVACTIPFNAPFTWDRTRPILLEVRVTGNSQGNQPFAFNHAGTTQLIGQTSRVYAFGNAGATTGQVQQGWGLITRFTARPGVMLEFGAGCPCQGNIIPQNSADQIASPGISWVNRLTNAPSQRTAFWVLGDTTQSPYPVNLTTLFGQPASVCSLLTNPISVIGTTTIGGGAGGGQATVPILTPGVAGYVGASVYTQWVVFDPLSINGFLCVTPGLWTIVAPIGG